MPLSVNKQYNMVLANVGAAPKLWS